MAGKKKKMHYKERNAEYCGIQEKWREKDYSDYQCFSVFVLILLTFK